LSLNVSGCSTSVVDDAPSALARLVARLFQGFAGRRADRLPGGFVSHTDPLKLGSLDGPDALIVRLTGSEPGTRQRTVTWWETTLQPT